jgi:nitroimidazol reductase NimA-like FMN-containing flavoprotein (pyridoxamine 5'-phosphate oxidase superfamily)
MDLFVEKAKQIIADNIYCTIATADSSGTPWISPVFFAYDSEYNLYWISNKDSRHSTYIRENPKVAIVVFDSRAPEGQGDGVYFKAEAKEMGTPEELASAIQLMNNRATKEEFRVKSATEVSSSGVWRIYKATPSEISKLTDGETIKGQYVDKREIINLK